MTRYKIEHLLGQVRSAAYGGDAPYPVSTHKLIAILEHALTEQSRIDAAVAKERERCAEALLVWRDSIPIDADGWYAGCRKGLESAAMMVRSMPAALPTPTTEEGA